MSLEDEDFAMQPINRVKPVQATDWGNRSLIIQRPILGAKIAQSIANWAEIEVVLGMLLASILHANEKAIIAIYGELENRAAQLRMLSSAAAATLPQQHADVFAVLMTTSIKPAMKYRDRLAHWCWGSAKELPDAILISEPASHLGGYAAALKAQGETGDENPGVPVDHHNVYVIRELDLDRYLNQLSELDLNLRMAMATVWSHNSQQERDEYLQKLSNKPLVRAGLARLAERRQKTQEAQQPSPPRDQSGGS